MTGRTRPTLEGLPAYRPGRSAESAAAEHGLNDAVKLASNEAPFAPLPSVVEAIARGTEQLATYPDHGASELRSAIGCVHGLSAECVAVGTGSVGILQQLALGYVDPGESVAFCWPSFEAYPVYAALVGAEQCRPPLRRQTFDLDALVDVIDERTKMVTIANPNNPTGTAVSLAELTAFVAKVPSGCLVVVDEAYAEFVTDRRVASAIGLLERFDNVVVLRTFSKAYGLAACRIGYAIAHPDVVEALDRTLVPFAVNGLAQRAALASLAARDEMSDRVKEVVAERTRVVGGLRRAGWGVPEPHGNFVWLPAGAASEALGCSLERRGVVTRVFPETGVRVTVADADANDRFLEAFDHVTAGGGPVAAEITAAWELPTGQLAIRVADELDRLESLRAQLEHRAGIDQPDGLTAPDAPSGERWDAGQVWAHLAEFGSYWRDQLATIIDSPIDGPVPFGRTKRDPHRIEMIERHRHASTAEHVAAVCADIAAVRADLAEMTSSDWGRRCRHETLGDMDVWTFLDHFVTGHYVEHVEQLDALRQGR